MFFKAALKQLGLLFLIGSSILLLCYCSNDKIKGDGDINVSLAYNTDCLNRMGDRWREWSEGNSSVYKVKSDLECLSKGVSYFLLRVRGEKTGHYTSKEIYNFINKFLKDTKIEMTTIDDFLVLKSWLMGGQRDQVSFYELSLISYFFRSIAEPLVSLTPNAKALFFQKLDVELTDSQAIEIKSALNLINREVNLLSEKNENTVNLEDFKSTLNRFLVGLDFEPFSDQKIESGWRSASLLLGKGEKGEISLNSKEGIQDLLFKAYYIGFRAKSGVLDIGWRNINSYVHFNSVINESLALIKSLILKQPEQYYSKQDLSEIIYNFLNIVELDFEVTQKFTDHVSETLIAKYFNSDVWGANEMGVLVNEWEGFQLFQNQTIVLQGLGFTGSLSEGQSFVSLSNLNYRALDFKWPMLSNDMGYVLNPLIQTELMANYGNLFWVNIERLLSSVFLSTYISDPNKKRDLIDGVTQSELKTGYTDVFQILNAIDYLGDDEHKAWFRIFNEANLFVPRSKPDEYLSFEEGIDYFALLFSGINFSKDINEKILKACMPLTKKCQIDWIKKSDLNIWQDFAPEFYKYMNVVSSGEWSDFIDGFEEMAREKVSAKPFERFELLKVSIAIQYIEIFLRKYDLNQDLLIDFNETVNSFDKFKLALLSLPQVKGTEAEDDPINLLAFYTFFMKKGRMPRKTFGKYIELLGWLGKVKSCVSVDSRGSYVARPNVSACEFEASRSNLIKILAFLANSL